MSFSLFSLSNLRLLSVGSLSLCLLAVIVKLKPEANRSTFIEDSEHEEAEN